MKVKEYEYNLIIKEKDNQIDKLNKLIEKL